MTSAEDSENDEQDLKEWARWMINEEPDSGIDAMVDEASWLAFVDHKVVQKTGVRATPTQLDALAQTRKRLLRRALKRRFNTRGG